MADKFFASEKIYTVSEINHQIRESLESSFFSIKLEGEISGFKPHSSGHLYFSLKDSNSVISAVMFRGYAQYLSFAPKDGMKVQVQGKITVYEPQGKYQLTITKMSISGEGDVLRMLEERKRKLLQEGIFENSHKKNIPLLPNTIGVVTSPTGAALRDILQITKRRNPGVNVVIFPCLVQGEGAAKTIVEQIENANAAKNCDTLIVGRGGGSLEDLLPFSEESVVRAIFNSEIPVISAVGHEIDWSLSDYAADKRAPTPSAAAELAIPQRSDIIQTLKYYQNELYTTISGRVEKIKLTLKTFEPENLELKLRSIQQPLLQRLDNAKEELEETMLLRIKDTKKLIENCTNLLESSSPQTIFNRGYSMVRDKKTGKIIRMSTEVQEGSEIEIIPSKGKIDAKVTGTVI